MDEQSSSAIRLITPALDMTRSRTPVFKIMIVTFLERIVMKNPVFRKSLSCV
jgi:hypothetical protein